MSETYQGLLALGSCMLGISIIAIALRFYSRISQKKPLKADDWLMIPTGEGKRACCESKQSGVLDDGCLLSLWPCNRSRSLYLGALRYVNNNENLLVWNISRGMTPLTEGNSKYAAKT